MIDIDEIKGKSVQYVGKISLCFSKGQYYRIGFDDDGESLFTIDDDGDYHSLTTDYIKEAFDVAAYIKKPSTVGEYVRYISDTSGFMRKGDIGIVVADADDGLEVRWLNPIEPHTDGCSAWYVSTYHVEFL